MKLLFLVGALLTLAGCTQPEKAESVLKEQGYKDVAITGYDFFACSDSDTFSTGFTATSPAGMRVSGTVCSGFLKGSTIRFK